MKYILDIPTSNRHGMKFTTEVRTGDFNLVVGI